MEFHSKEAIYLQIVQMVCENILTRKWVEGEKIPSVRELAVSIEVNPNTVLRAYGFLQEKGVIRMQRGIGYFVEENAFEETMGFMKSRFFEKDLPQLFKSMKLLNIGIGEIKTRFDEFTESEGDDEDKQ